MGTGTGETSPRPMRTIEHIPVTAWQEVLCNGTVPPAWSACERHVPASLSECVGGALRTRSLIRFPLHSRQTHPNISHHIFQVHPLPFGLHLPEPPQPETSPSRPRAVPGDQEPHAAGDAPGARPGAGGAGSARGRYHGGTLGGGTGAQGDRGHHGHQRWGGTGSFVGGAAMDV